MAKKRYLKASVQIDDYVDVEIEVGDIIGDIDTKDLIDELRARGTSVFDFEEEKTKAILGLAGQDLNLRNLLKMEAILEKFDRIPESNLDEFLSKY